MDLINQLRGEINKFIIKRHSVPISVIVRLTESFAQLEAKIVDVEKNLDEVLKENQKLHENSTKSGVESGLTRDVRKFYNCEQNSDFTIKIGDKVFKLHKFMLAARSSVLSDMMKCNNDATQLDLFDIPVATFEIILNFIYFEKFPDESSNFNEIFMVSCRLNLKDLMAFSGAKIQIDDENVFEVFSLANKYNHTELKLKCFNSIQKMFPNHQLKPEFINQPDMLKQFISEMKSMEEMIKNFKQKYEMFIKIE